jgi:hypothetical protein
MSFLRGEDKGRSHPLGLQRNQNKTATNEHYLRDLERRQRRNGEAATIRERNRTLERNISIVIGQLCRPGTDI